MASEKRPVRIVGAIGRLVDLLNAPGLEITPGTAETLADGRFEVMGYASDDALAGLRGLDIHPIGLAEPQPFERAAARETRPTLRFIRIEADRELMRSLPDLPGLKLDDHGARALDGGRGRMYADATDRAIAALRALGFDVTIE